MNFNLELKSSPKFQARSQQIIRVSGAHPDAFWMSCARRDYESKVECVDSYLTVNLNFERRTSIRAELQWEVNIKCSWDANLSKWNLRDIDNLTSGTQSSDVCIQPWRPNCMVKILNFQRAIWASKTHTLTTVSVTLSHVQERSICEVVICSRWLDREWQQAAWVK